jgi:hypothetical protein
MYAAYVYRGRLPDHGWVVQPKHVGVYKDNVQYLVIKTYTVEPGYNIIGLYDTSSIASDILWYQLIPHC